MFDEHFRTHVRDVSAELAVDVRLFNSLFLRRPHASSRGRASLEGR
jgi:hypothetical protein